MNRTFDGTNESMNLSQSEIKDITSKIIHDREETTKKGLVGKIGARKILMEKLGLDRKEAGERLSQLPSIMVMVDESCEIELPHWKIEDLK